jgi:hypothetical protein
VTIYWAPSPSTGLLVSVCDQPPLIFFSVCGRKAITKQKNKHHHYIIVVVVQLNFSHAVSKSCIHVFIFSNEKPIYSQMKDYFETIPFQECVPSERLLSAERTACGGDR